jgi:hypothetical protein
MPVHPAEAAARLVLMLAVAGCVPSHRVVAEGDHYFEQCYGRDFEPIADDRAREACWESWLAHYTRHQPASRVDYALRRVEDLQSGVPLAQLPGVGAPMPDQQQAIDSEGAPDPAEVTAPVGAPRALPKGCEPACDAYTARCEAQCTADAHDCRPMCERERKRCLSGCH